MVISRSFGMVYARSANPQNSAGLLVASLQIQRNHDTIRQPQRQLRQRLSKGQRISPRVETAYTARRACTASHGIERRRPAVQGRVLTADLSKQLDVKVEIP